MADWSNPQPYWLRGPQGVQAYLAGTQAAVAQGHLRNDTKRLGMEMATDALKQQLMSQELDYKSQMLPVQLEAMQRKQRNLAHDEEEFAAAYAEERDPDLWDEDNVLKHQQNKILEYTAKANAYNGLVRAEGELTRAKAAYASQKRLNAVNDAASKFQTGLKTITGPNGEKQVVISRFNPRTGGTDWIPQKRDEVTASPDGPLVEVHGGVPFIWTGKSWQPIKPPKDIEANIQAELKAIESGEKTTEAAQAAISSIMSGYMAGFGGAERKPSARVKVKGTDGKFYTVPESQLDAALREGYTRAE